MQTFVTSQSKVRSLLAINDGTEFQAAMEDIPPVIFQPTVHLQSWNPSLISAVNPEDIAYKWNLNKEQLQVFHIIVDHSEQRAIEPLCMFISGPAGTGKTRVINGVSTTRSNLMFSSCFLHGDCGTAHFWNDNTCRVKYGR